MAFFILIFSTMGKISPLSTGFKGNLASWLKLQESDAAIYSVNWWFVIGIFFAISIFVKNWLMSLATSWQLLGNFWQSDLPSLWSVKGHSLVFPGQFINFLTNFNHSTLIFQALSPLSADRDNLKLNNRTLRIVGGGHLMNDTSTGSSYL